LQHIGENSANLAIIFGGHHEKIPAVVATTQSSGPDQI